MELVVEGLRSALRRAFESLVEDSTDDTDLSVNRRIGSGLPWSQAERERVDCSTFFTLSVESGNDGNDGNDGATETGGGDVGGDW